MNIRKLPSGSYQVRKQYKGKQYTFTLDHKPTQKEVIQLLAEKFDNVVNKGTFREYAEQYIKEKENILAPSSQNTYEHKIDYFTEDFQNTQLSELTEAMVTKEINRYAKTHSPKSTKDLYGFVTAVCGLYRPKLVLNVTTPKKEKKVEYLPTTEDVRKVLQRAKGEPVEIPLYLATLGLRRSEIMAVTYEDLSDDNWLLINKAKVRKPKKGYAIKTTKTTAGTRQVPVPKEIADLIREQQYKYTFGENYITKTLHRYQDELNIPWFKLHSMRKHFASIGSKFLGKSDTKVVGGWASENFMESVYWYSTTKDEDVKSAIEKMYENIKKDDIENKDDLENNLEYLQDMVNKMVNLLKSK